jgi:Family of unknown function (DUF6174)
MSSRAAVSLALLTLTLAAGAPAAVAQYQGVKPDPHIADGTLQHKLDVARGSWRATRFASGYRSLATVPRLFKTIQGAIDEGVANLNVSYGRRGVPTSIYIDRSQLIADEEMGYEIKAFTPSKRHAR